MDVLKELLRPELIWFLVGLVLLLLEFTMPGLIIFFFGVGAWIVAALCFASTYVHDSINMQLLIFLVSSILSLLVLRKWLKGIFHGHTDLEQDLTQDMEEFVGQKAVVTTKISPKKGGKVELNGTNWKAESDMEIEEGVTVEVVSKDNITLKVRAI
jgi:membrane protein implicated in regulation of membrane protease activity